MPLLLVSYVPSDRFCFTINKEGEGLETHHVTTIICLPVVTSDSFDIVHNGNGCGAPMHCIHDCLEAVEFFGHRALS